MKTVTKRVTSGSLSLENRCSVNELYTACLFHLTLLFYKEAETILYRRTLQSIFFSTNSTILCEALGQPFPEYGSKHQGLFIMRSPIQDGNCQHSERGPKEFTVSGMETSCGLVSFYCQILIHLFARGCAFPFDFRCM